MSDPSLETIAAYRNNDGSTSSPIAVVARAVLRLQQEASEHVMAVGMEMRSISSLMRVRKITKTCGSMPAQWEGHTADDRSLYIRYRHGRFSVQVSDPGGTLEEAMDAPPLIAEQDVARGGHMDDSEMHNRTDRVFDWGDISGA